MPSITPLDEAILSILPDEKNPEKWMPAPDVTRQPKAFGHDIQRMATIDENDKRGT